MIPRIDHYQYAGQYVGISVNCSSFFCSFNFYEMNELHTEEFVEWIRQRKILYDLNDPNYKNIRMKDDLWHECAQAFDLESNMVTTI